MWGPGDHVDDIGAKNRDLDHQARELQLLDSKVTSVHSRSAGPVVGRSR